MIKKQVNGITWDIFWDTGWNNWARIENRKGFIQRVGGEEIPKHIFSILIQEFKNHGN